MSTTPPRNVIYYNDGSNPISLTQISSCYTDVILALVPDDNLNAPAEAGTGGRPEGSAGCAGGGAGGAECVPQASEVN